MTDLYDITFVPYRDRDAQRLMALPRGYTTKHLDRAMTHIAKVEVLAARYAMWWDTDKERWYVKATFAPGLTAADGRSYIVSNWCATKPTEEEAQRIAGVAILHLVQQARTKVRALKKEAAAERRAESVLMRYLDREQRRMWRQYRCFIAYTRTGRRAYLLGRQTPNSHVVYRVLPYSKQVGAHGCVLINGHHVVADGSYAYETVPPSDHLLACLLAIQNNASRFEHITCWDIADDDGYDNDSYYRDLNQFLELEWKRDRRDDQLAHWQKVAALL